MLEHLNVEEARRISKGTVSTPKQTLSESKRTVVHAISSFLGGQSVDKKATEENINSTTKPPQADKKNPDPTSPKQTAKGWNVILCIACLATAAWVAFHWFDFSLDDGYHCLIVALVASIVTMVTIFWHRGAISPLTALNVGLFVALVSLLVYHSKEPKTRIIHHNHHDPTKITLEFTESDFDLTQDNIAGSSMNTVDAAIEMYRQSTNCTKSISEEDRQAIHRMTKQDSKLSVVYEFTATRAAKIVMLNKATSDIATTALAIYQKTEELSQNVLDAHLKLPITTSLTPNTINSLTEYTEMYEQSLSGDIWKRRVKVTAVVSLVTLPWAVGWVTAAGTITMADVAYRYYQVYMSMTSLGFGIDMGTLYFKEIAMCKDVILWGADKLGEGLTWVSRWATGKTFHPWDTLQWPEKYNDFTGNISSQLNNATQNLKAIVTFFKASPKAFGAFGPGSLPGANVNVVNALADVNEPMTSSSNFYALCMNAFKVDNENELKKVPIVKQLMGTGDTEEGKKLLTVPHVDICEKMSKNPLFAMPDTLSEITALISQHRGNQVMLDALETMYPLIHEWTEFSEFRRWSKDLVALDITSTEKVDIKTRLQNISNYTLQRYVVPMLATGVDMRYSEDSLESMATRKVARLGLNELAAAYSTTDTAVRNSLVVWKELKTRLEGHESIRFHDRDKVLALHTKKQKEVSSTDPIDFSDSQVALTEYSWLTWGRDKMIERLFYTSFVGDALYND